MCRRCCKWGRRVCLVQMRSIHGKAKRRTGEQRSVQLIKQNNSLLFQSQCPLREPSITCPFPLLISPAMDPATVKFAQALPFVLLPASSHLAALHTASARPAIPAACPRCGADATFQHTRIARRSKQTRVILTTCAACDGVVSAPFPSGTLPSFNARKPKSIAEVPSSQLLVQASSVPVSDQLNLAPKAVTPVAAVSANRPPPATLGSSNNKNKKKSGLQQMLERNREKERHKANAADAKQSSGLSAFLSAL